MYQDKNAQELHPNIYKMMNEKKTLSEKKQAYLPKGQFPRLATE